MIIIEMKNNKTTIIDDIDSDLADLKWSTNKNYVYRTVCNPNRYHKRSIFIHRIILSRILVRELLSSEEVDHINLNRLDNRRENLRLATHSQNGQNRKMPKRNTSGYKGVTWNSKNQKWQVQLSSNGKTIYIGQYKDKEVAYDAYCKAIKNHHKDFARFD